MCVVLKMAENTKKKTNARSIIKSVLNIFRKDDKKEKTVETERTGANTKVTSPVISPAARFRDKFEKLEQRERENQNYFSFEKIDADEDRNVTRLESQSSEDSGFIEKEEESVRNDVTDIFSKLIIDENKGQLTEKKETEKAGEACDNVTESLKKLNLGEIRKKKEKKVITVSISRSPIVNKNHSSRHLAHPYEKPCSQVTVNKQTFSGGQVIEHQEFLEVSEALDDLFSSSIVHENKFNKEENLEIIADLIQEELNNNTIESEYQYLGNVIRPPGDGQNDNIVPERTWGTLDEDNIVPERTWETLDQRYPQAGDGQNEKIDMNRILETFNQLEKIIGTGDNLLQLVPDIQTCPPISPVSPNDSHNDEKQPIGSVFFTPPNSVSMQSPISEFQPSPRRCPSTSDYISSPAERSSPDVSDAEIYQKIVYQDQSAESDNEKKMTLKQFKNMQREISESFCDKECCEKNRKSCTEIFNERFAKFKPVERKNICLNVNRLDLKAALGVLVRILQSIGKGSDKEDLEYSIFRHVCGRVLAEQPAWFLGDFGAQLLELAALQCNGHPVLTRYLVECMRAVQTPEGLESRDCLLPLRVDSKRDNLVLACVARGDPFADVLYWLVAREPHQRPLFDLRHVNTEGYSALHVACKAHGAASPRLRAVHVLLEHGRADLWQGDHKGGDTALHLAINSPSCDLELVLLLFHHAEQKQWKRLATWNNLGCVTPIEYARCAVRSKRNFPVKVLEFMKKLR